MIHKYIAIRLHQKGVSNLQGLVNFEWEDLSCILDGLDEAEESTALRHIELSALWKSSQGTLQVSLAALHKQNTAPRFPSTSTAYLVQPLTTRHHRAVSDTIAESTRESLKKAKMDKLMGKVVLDFSSAVESTEESTELTRLPTQASEKALRSATYLWDMLVEMGDRGTLWAESLLDVDFRITVAAGHVAKWSLLNQVAEYAKIAKRWREWCSQRNLRSLAPDASMVEAFCIHEGSGIPTQPRHVFNCMRWLEINIGLPACSDSQKVRRATDHPSSHVSRREEPWPF